MLLNAPCVAAIFGCVFLSREVFGITVRASYIHSRISNGRKNKQERCVVMNSRPPEEEEIERHSLRNGKTLRTFAVQVITVGGSGERNSGEYIGTPTKPPLPPCHALDWLEVPGCAALRDVADVGTESLDRGPTCRDGGDRQGAGALVAVVEAAHLFTPALCVHQTLTDIARPEEITGAGALGGRWVKRSSRYCGEYWLINTGAKGY